MIIRARAVVPMCGAAVANGAVAIRGDRITAVGTVASVRTEHEGDVVDLGDCALLPGFINTHCHLDYTCLRGRIPRQRRFTDWIRAINACKAALTPDDYLRSISDGLDEALRFGTTSLVNFEAFPELVARVPPHAIRTWWCGEMIDLRAEVDADAVAEQCAAGDRRSGLAPHAPFTASRKLYEQCGTAAARRELLLSTHLAESRDEMQLFRDGAGPLFDFLRELGRPMDDAGAGTPLAQTLPLLDSSWIVAHLNELTENDFALLSDAPKFTVVHCPRSHSYFNHTPFAFDRLQALGYNVCLATDSLASTPDLSLLAELREMRGVSPEQAVACITKNAGQAVQRPLGQLQPGYFADLIALPIASERDLYEQIVAFEGEVPWVMIGGSVVRSAM